MKLQKQILCVDDDADDRFFLSQAIDDLNAEVVVVEAQNGLEALDYLNDVKNSGKPLPCLIILDINMPYLDGKQTFQRIRADSFFSKIPVVVFTNSGNPNDKTLFKSFGVDLFVKPDNISYMNEIAHNLLSYCS
jgi:CheY-like chemotaxis protein